jgi:uncharacterized protein YeaO (DUF488 family)
MILVKSIFDEASAGDGFRVLVEPAWPRKAHREKTPMNVWLRSLAPSLALGVRFSGNLISWEEFVAGYHHELEENRDFIRDLKDHTRKGGLTLLHGASDIDRNTAVALKMFLENDTPVIGGSRVMV